jgi:hypothetical protein
VTTTPDTQLSLDPDTALSEACGNLDAKLARTDQKAGLLGAFAAGIFAGAATVNRTHLPLPALLTYYAAGLALFASAVFLLLVVLPDLGGPRHPIRPRCQVTPVDFVLWKDLPADTLYEEMRRDTRATSLKTQSVLADAKYRYLAFAIYALLTTLALLLLTAITALAGWPYATALAFAAVSALLWRRFSCGRPSSR